MVPPVRIERTLPRENGILNPARLLPALDFSSHLISKACGSGLSHHPERMEWL